jgi:hypothetical protein
MKKPWDIATAFSGFALLTICILLVPWMVYLSWWKMGEICSSETAVDMYRQNVVTTQTFILLNCCNVIGRGHTRETGNRNATALSENCYQPELNTCYWMKQRKLRKRQRSCLNLRCSVAVISFLGVPSAIKVVALSNFDVLSILKYRHSMFPVSVSFLIVAISLRSHHIIYISPEQALFLVSHSFFVSVTLSTC